MFNSLKQLYIFNMNYFARKKVRELLYKQNIYEIEQKKKMDEEELNILKKNIVACVDVTNKAMVNFKNNIENAMLNGEKVIRHHDIIFPEHISNAEYVRTMNYVYNINNRISHVSPDVINLEKYKMADERYIYHDVHGNIFPIKYCDSMSIDRYYINKGVIEKLEDFPIFYLTICNDSDRDKPTQLCSVKTNSERSTYYDKPTKSFLTMHYYVW